MQSETIEIRGAAEHNLRSVNLEIPKRKLVVFTGVSGSGKTSLAFDTLFAEGNRRYVESLSTYARQFLGQMHKPRFETIRGLAPAISVQQKALTQNPRSTVGTITEIYDFLRLLFARVGTQHCPGCGAELTCRSAQEMVADVMKLPPGTRFILLAPFAEACRGPLAEAVRAARRKGFVRGRIGGTLRSLDEEVPDDGAESRTFEVVVDRLVMKEDVFDRVSDSVELAAKIGDGAVVVSPEGLSEMSFSEKLACRRCGVSLPPATPLSFSFNSPHGMCPRCQGLGSVLEVDPGKIVPDASATVAQGAVRLFKTQDKNAPKKYFQKELETFCQSRSIPLDMPFGALSEEQRRLILFGDPAAGPGGFEGAAGLVRRRLGQTKSTEMQGYYRRFFAESACPSCRGARLCGSSLAVAVQGESITDVTAMTISESAVFFEGLEFEGGKSAVAAEIVREIRSRLRFLADVGVGYLTLDRQGGSLSGGESQRIHLASQLGSDLTGVMYILDEPSIGLHVCDTDRLVGTLRALRDAGNTVIVVEHDPGIIRQSDHIVDFGPGAGVNGGMVMYSGPVAGIGSCEASLTGAYLSGRKSIPVPQRRSPGGKSIRVIGASQNNLKDIDVDFPLGLLICVSGVSGAGKSSLVNQVLYPALVNGMRRRNRFREGSCRRIAGLGSVSRVVSVDQKPIGRTPRSNPVIYTGAFNAVRDLFASLREAKAYGYDKSRFSFNVKGGRCEACQGDGIRRIEMHFLPDVFVPCDVCGGGRYNQATLKVRYKGFSIADVLDLTVREALDLFANHPQIVKPLEALSEVGLDYVRLGQSSTTLSGGEAQRVKLARELSKAGTGDTVYMLDEPTTGLHYDDIRKLLDVLGRLVDAGNTVIVVEHNLEVLKCADHIIDLGPCGGRDGGRVVAEGTPEKVARTPESTTGKYLAAVLASASKE